MKGSTCRKKEQAGNKLEVTAVKATQEEINRTPRRPKVEQHIHKRIGQKYPDEWKF